LTSAHAITPMSISRFAAGAANVVLRKLENCRHSPHRDQPDAVIDATVEFLRQFQPLLRPRF
jgi:pimeloyl-ACP methyl ester carboxylesterase